MPQAAPTEAALMALAQVVGAHALAWFLLMLALVLLAAVVAVRWLWRFAAWRDGHDGDGLARLALNLGLGFALIVGAGFLFAALAGEIDPADGLSRVDKAFSEAVRMSTSQAALQVFGWVTHLGDPLTLVALCVGAALVLWIRGERLLAVAFVAALGGNALLNPALKQVFERVRPQHGQVLTHFGGWSFPSGHSSGALVAYGMLAYVLLRTVPRGWHLPAVLLAVAAAFAVGCSRVFLQAHFASDVVAGFASGTAWLATCIASVELVRARRRRPTPAVD